MNYPYLSENNKYYYCINRYTLNDLFQQNFLIIDLEATGLDYSKEDIIEIAWMPIENLYPKLEKSESYLVKQSKKIPKFIEKLTGITNKEARNGHEIKYVLKLLADKFNNYIWVAQCGFEFDFPFLKRVFQENLDLKLPAKNILDTKLLYLYLYPYEKETISTNFLLKKYNVSSPKKRHRASTDVEILSKIFLKILKEYKQKNIFHIKINSPIKIKKFVPK